VGIMRTACVGVGEGVGVVMITLRTELSADVPWTRIARTMMRIKQRVRACIQAHKIVLNVSLAVIKLVKYDVVNSTKSKEDNTVGVSYNDPKKYPKPKRVRVHGRVRGSRSCIRLRSLLKGFWYERLGGPGFAPDWCRARACFFKGLSSPYQMLKEPVFKPQTGQGESDLQGATGKQTATGKTDHFLSILMINNDRSAIVFALIRSF